MSIVSPAQARAFEAEGFMILPSVIPSDALEMLREQCLFFLGCADASLDAGQLPPNGISRRGGSYFIANRYRLSTRIWKFIFGEQMAQIVESTLGPDAFLFHEQWVVKGAGDGRTFAWHQDSGYVKRHHPSTDHSAYLTCWCALDDVDEANGTLHLLPYSRTGTRNAVLEHQTDEISGDLVAYVGDDAGDAVSLPAGSIVAFTSRVLHRSGPNQSNRTRRVYVVQYSGAPITDPDGLPCSMAVPFLKRGKVVYDPGADTFANWGPVEREDRDRRRVDESARAEGWRGSSRGKR